MTSSPGADSERATSTPSAMRGDGWRSRHWESSLASGRLITTLATTSLSSSMLSQRVFQLVIFRRKAVSPSPRRMLMAIPVMVVPDRTDVARVGFEEESGDGVDA
jgi:hypothetical protein